MARVEDTLEETPPSHSHGTVREDRPRSMPNPKTPWTPLYRTTVYHYRFFGRLTLILNRRHVVPYLSRLDRCFPPHIAILGLIVYHIDWFKIETSCIITPEISSMSDLQKPGLHAEAPCCANAWIVCWAHSCKFLAASLRLSGTVLGKYERHRYRATLE